MLKKKIRPTLERLYPWIVNKLSKQNNPPASYQAPLILLLPLVGFLEVLLSYEALPWWAPFYIYSEVLIIVLCGHYGMKRSMWGLLAFYYTWVWNSLWVLHLMDHVVSITFAGVEALIFAVLTYWIYKRPERMPSDPHSEDTVQIAFYHGDKFPLIGKVSWFLGLPVGGIGIILNNEGILMRGKTGRLEKRKRVTFKKWIILDTKIETNYHIIDEFNKLEGHTTSKSGCVSAMTPFLSSLGEHYEPSGLQSPSSYMSQLLDLRPK